MTSITNLNTKFDSLKIKIANYSNFENLTVSEFKAYKNLLLQKQKINNKIKLYEMQKEKFEQEYNSKNVKWLYDDNLSCRKYCRLEKYANYKKERNLFRLGYLDKRPLFPIIKSMKEHFEFYYLDTINDKKQSIKHKLSSYWNSTKKRSPIYQKTLSFINFKNNILPQKLNRIAINGTKSCISGYRKFHSSTRFISKSISNIPVIQILSGAYSQAKKELDYSPNSFQNRIKINPQSLNCSKNSGIKSSNELDLAL